MLCHVLYMWHVSLEDGKKPATSTATKVAAQSLLGSMYQGIEYLGFWC